MTIKQPSTYRSSFQRRTLQSLFQLFMLSTAIILIGGAVALLLAYQQGRQIGRAAGDVSVVGTPTLSAATIDAIFARVGSPMMGTGKLVEQASRQTNIDDAFALGVWWTETNDGEAGVGLADRNPGSVRGSEGYPSAFDGYTIYPSYTTAIIYWFNMLRNDYVDGRGLSTVYTIARPYVGTTNYPLWAGKVINLMYSYRGIAPPPPVVTATLSPTPTINPSVVVANLAQQYKRHKLTQLLLLRSDRASSVLADQGETQETYVGTPPAEMTAALPRPVELAIVLFGLLTALAIALYSFKLKISAAGEQAEVHPKSVEASVPSTDDLPALPAFIRLPVREDLLPGQTSPTRDGRSAPSTDDLPVLPARVRMIPRSGVASQRQVTDALPRRVTLLPPRTEAGTVVSAVAGSGERTPSGGLLSRYGKTNSN